MASIPFPLGSFPGRRTHESAGRLINCYGEPLGPGAVGQAKIVSSAGMLKFSEAMAVVSAGPPSVTVALGAYRGSILVGNVVYAAFATDVPPDFGVLVAIDSDGMVMKVHDLPGVGRVQFSRNNRTPTPDVVVTTSAGTYVFHSSTFHFFDVPDMDERTNCFMDGYTFYGAASGRIQASGINDAEGNGLGGPMDALAWTIVQAKPGQLQRLIAYDQHLFAFCTTWTEVFRNTANPEGFPFSRVAVINRGLITPYAVAGYQDGFGKALVWVGDDCGVHVLNGYEASRISTPDVDRDIEALEDKDGIEAQCYITSGAAFITISSPVWTWEFNLTTQNWNERASRRRDGTQLKRWRSTGDSIFGFGKWLVGDTESGKLLEVTSDSRMEDDAPLVMRIESAPVHDFPRGMNVPRVDFNLTPGIGRAPGIDPIQVDPQVSIAWSDDGGLHWSNPLLRRVGRQDRNPEVTVLRTGRTAQQGRRWALEISDPVYVSLLGGDMTAEAEV